MDRSIFLLLGDSGLWLDLFFLNFFISLLDSSAYLMYVVISCSCGHTILTYNFYCWTFTSFMICVIDI